jgi:hypothetical protein
MSATDPGAFSFMNQIITTLQSDLYQMFFPERIPEGNLANLWTQSKITLAGRTISHPQKTIEGQGINSGWARMHFNRFFSDDLVNEKSTLADMQAVRNSLQNISGLYMPAFHRPICRHHIGTIYDEMDDHGYLSTLKACLTILVPIVSYDGGMPEDITILGTPTNPEWHTTNDGLSIIENIQLIQESIVSDEGADSWRKNYLLDPSAGGGRMLPMHLMKQQDYRKVRLPNGRFRIELYAKDERGEILKENGQPKILKKIDPWKDLYIAFGVDPSFSDAGDDWGITILGVDHDGFFYQLQTVKGKGWSNLANRLWTLNRSWRPKTIGWEAQTAQAAIDELFRQEPQLRQLEYLIQRYSHDNKGKPWRILNFVVENLKMKKLYLDPDDSDFKNEGVKYKPESKHAVDNMLDSMAIAIAVARRAKDPAKHWKKRLEAREQRLGRQTDRRTGVRIKYRI